jgi:outer membrane protein assembly factor BamB
VAADGTIYVPTAAGVDAVNPNGTRRWRWSAGISVPFCTPAIGADGTIYVIGNPNDALLIALNPNGTVRWSLYLGGTEVRSSPAIGPDGRIYVTNGQTPGGYLYCVNPNGTIAWRLYLDWEANSTPCFGEDGTIYVGSANYLNAVRPDGTLLWRFPTFYPVQGHVSRSGNRLFFGSLDYAFRCVNLTGQLQWSFITRGYIDGGPALADDRVYFVRLGWSPLRLLFGRRYILEYIDWFPHWFPAVGADGTIYVMGNGGWSILAINPANGLTRWRSFPTSQILAVPLLLEEMVLSMFWMGAAGSMPSDP